VSGPASPGPAGRERVLAFAGAALIAVYVLGDEDGALRLAETGGGAPRDGLPERYPLTGRSPAAYALGTGRPLWLDAAEFAAWHQTAPGTGPFPAGESLGVLPLRAGAGGRPRGCLLVVGDAVDGFGPEQRGFLERYADEIAAGLASGGTSGGTPGGTPGGTWSVLGPALKRLRAGGFVLTPSTGLITADAALLDLVDISPADFDDDIETPRRISTFSPNFSASDSSTGSTRPFGTELSCSWAQASQEA